MLCMELCLSGVVHRLCAGLCLSGEHTLSASLRSLVRSTILGLGPKGMVSISLSRVALPLEPPPPDTQTDTLLLQ